MEEVHRMVHGEFEAAVALLRGVVVVVVEEIVTVRVDRIRGGGGGRAVGRDPDLHLRRAVGGEGAILHPDGGDGREVTVDPGHREAAVDLQE